MCMKILKWWWPTLLKHPHYNTEALCEDKETHNDDFVTPSENNKISYFNVDIDKADMNEMDTLSIKYIMYEYAVSYQLSWGVWSVLQPLTTPPPFLKKRCVDKLRNTKL